MRYSPVFVFCSLRQTACTDGDTLLRISSGGQMRTTHQAGNDLRQGSAWRFAMSDAIDSPGQSSAAAVAAD